MRLFADKACWQFKREMPGEWKTFGCGPGGLGDWLVPDTMWGLDISEACRIHDWYYRFWPENTIEAKDYADRILLNNLVRIITSRTKCRWLLKLRLLRAKEYYIAVKDFGGPAWWDERNEKGEMV